MAETDESRERNDSRAADATQADVGQGTEVRVLRTAQVVFLALCALVLAIPLIATPLVPTMVTSEKKDLAAWPSLATDDGPNLSYLHEAGAWFEDHYAFRSALVDADARLRSTLLLSSTTPRVIVGTDGWLYYQGTLDDYQRTNVMSSRALFNAAHNLALMQEAAEAAGACFCLLVAPNKNTLYPGHMPWWLPAGDGAGNAERLDALADSLGVHSVDVASALGPSAGATGAALYYRRDSHWTNEGARLAANALLEAVGRERHSFDAGAAAGVSHVGDIDEMLRPLSAEAEADVTYVDAQRFSWEEGDGDVTANTIVTASTAPGADGSALVFRDSFGNALVPYLASAFSRAHFSKLVPYDFGLLASVAPDVVVIERAERHLSSFATTPPYLLAPEREVDVSTALDVGEVATLTARVNGPYLQLGGSVDADYLSGSSLVYLGLSSDGGPETLYEALLVSSQADAVSDVDAVDEPGADEVVGDGGYRVFLPVAHYGELDGLRARVYVYDGSYQLCVLDTSLEGRDVA